MKVLVSNIQRFCLMDGPGIRTTVFTMGCRYRCPWCCNPENLTTEIKVGKNTNLTYGKYLDEEEIINIILRDKKYYESNGGVTFSGGEFLLSINEYENVLSKLKKEGINICIETSLNAPLNNLVKALKYVNELIIDFKIIDNNISESILKYSSNSFIENIKYLSENGNNIPFVARIPLAKEIIEDNNLLKIKELLFLNKPKKLEVFKIHNLAKSKYDDLGLKLEYNFIPSDDEIKNVIDYFKNLDIQIEEIKI